VPEHDPGKRLNLDVDKGGLLVLGEVLTCVWANRMSWMSRDISCERQSRISWSVSL